MLTLFNDWFTYNEDANNKIIAELVTKEVLNRRAMEICSHLLNAHQIWLMRIQGINQGMPGVWQEQEKNRFLELNRKVHQETKNCLQSEQFGRDIHQLVNYVNTRGDKFINTVQEIYFHILAHSAYHRGQLALILRQEDIDPPLTDYIMYKR